MNYLMFCFYLYICRKFWCMTLRELEKSLQGVRKDTSVSYPWLSLKGLKYETIIKIHNGKNYRLSSLFHYLDLLACVLYVDGQMAENAESLGDLLREKRIAAGLTVVDISSKLKCTQQIIYNLENGKSSSRNTLSGYISCIGDISFSIREMIDVL